MESRILRCPEVCHRIGASRATLYRLIRASKFPKSIKISTRLRGWRSEDVQDWISNRDQS